MLRYSTHKYSIKAIISLFILRKANSYRNNIVNVGKIKKNASMGVSCNMFKEPCIKYEIPDLIDPIHISHS